MGALDGLLNQVKDAITQHGAGGGDASKLLSHVTDLFDKHPHNNRDVKPASQDPYGDPADGANGNGARSVKPASKDPYGDPADQKP
jgi:hypothetical protein